MIKCPICGKEMKPVLNNLKDDKKPRSVACCNREYYFTNSGYVYKDLGLPKED